jgi:hypothetical protein
MTSKEKIKLIEDLIARKQKVDVEFEKIFAIFGCVPESNLHESVYGMFDSYTDTVSAMIGDTHNYLAWYLYENDCGKNKFEVVQKKTETKKQKKWIVKDVKTLVQVIES